MISPPNNLDDRYTQFKYIVLSQVEQDSILCLQDVSSTWLDKIAVTLEDKHYTIIHAANGVLIAYPRKKYCMIERNVVNVDDRIPKATYTTTADMLNMIWQRIRAALRHIFIESRPTVPKTNYLVHCKLNRRADNIAEVSPIDIYTCHMHFTCLKKQAAHMDIVKDIIGDANVGCSNSNSLRSIVLAISANYSPSSNIHNHMLTHFDCIPFSDENYSCMLDCNGPLLPIKAKLQLDYVYVKNLDIKSHAWAKPFGIIPSSGYPSNHLFLAADLA